MPDQEAIPYIQREALLAEFGERAGQACDLQELLTTSAELAANVLDVPYVKVLEWRRSDGNFVVRAGVGWHDGVIGQATVGGDLESPAGYALKSGMPVIANDLSREKRFRTPRLLAEHDVRGAVNVVIRGRERIFGVLEADSRGPKAFTDLDVRFLQGIANLLGLAIDRQYLGEANAELLRRRELLFREFQHRIKNNSQTLISMMNLQISRSQNPETRDVVRGLVARVSALNLLDSQLYLGADVERLDLGRYLGDLLSSLMAFHHKVAGDVRLKADIAEVHIGPDRAKAVGLITNEFVMNSFKHAFAEAGGTLSVSLRCADGMVTLKLADTGPGLPAERRDDGLGLLLTNALTRQLGGSLRLDGPPGTRLALRFPLGPADSGPPDRRGPGPA